METIAQQLRVKEFPFEIFDKKGNRIYHEDSEGYWWRKEIDSQGNKTYFENSEGYWCKKEYDSQGNQIYYEVSDGFWAKRKFDSNGNEVYFENSYGTVIDNRIVPEFTMEQLVEKLGNFKIKK